MFSAHDIAIRPQYGLSLVAGKHYLGVNDKVRHKLAFIALEASLMLGILNIEMEGIILLRHRTIKVMIKLRI